METIQKKAPIISASSFALVLLFCLLPFISVQCSGQKIVEATGVELLTGSLESKVSKAADSSSEEKEKNPNVFMILMFLAAIAGIAVSIIFKDDSKKYSVSVICSSATISASLLLMRFYLASKMKSEGGGGGEYDKLASEIAGMISINYEIGYWLCLLLPIALILFIALVNGNGRRLQYAE